MRRTILSTGSGIILATLLTCSTRAQTLNIWPGIAPGSENWTQKGIKVDDTRLGAVRLTISPTKNNNRRVQYFSRSSVFTSGWTRR